MIKAGILDGDYVIVRPQPSAEQGEMVVAVIEGEATVKRFYREGDKIRLQPENDNMGPILVGMGDVRVVGKVIGVVRIV
ncbi:MAG: LexA family protein [bacterium]